jgi:hypothetical protein
MNEHLPVLESAISDVGYWTWWIAHLPDTFQVEFGATQLWSPPTRCNGRAWVHWMRVTKSGPARVRRVLPTA